MADPLPDEAAFEKLEQRVLGLITELRESKRRETELRGTIAEKDQTISRLRQERGEAERKSDIVRKRVVSLIERVDKLEKAG